MSSKTEIAWTDATWNPTSGCTRVSEGCRHCYIDRTPPFRMNGRKFVHGTTGVQLHPDRLDQPLKWKKPRRIFVNSLSDLFHEDVPDRFIDQVMRAMANTKRHVYQVLTKRPERMLDYLSGWWKRCYQDSETGEYIPVNPCQHIWFGVSVESQETADERIPLLLQTPAAVRFVSAEPLLGPVDLEVGLEAFHSHDPMLNRNPSPISWVIVGGESGPGARPCDVAWIRAIKEQCQSAGVPVFVKQLGSKPFSEPDRIIHRKSTQKLSNGFYRFLTDRKGGDWSEWPEDLMVREFP